MGIIYRRYLDGHAHVYCCSECKTHLSYSDALISKAFQGHHGRAWLFHHVVNITEGPAQERSMTTGHHTVCDIFCVYCQCVLGWKYQKAFEEDQKYKEGKYILERSLLVEDGKR
ncbi:Yippee/Mis18 [Phlyctochytrium arcticum]|nr:Yippee/Mis18 [Phlyctochytrium arcticum]